MSAEHGEIHGGAWADGGPDSMTFRHHEGSPGRTNAENEAELISRQPGAGLQRDRGEVIVRRPHVVRLDAAPAGRGQRHGSRKPSPIRQASGDG